MKKFISILVVVLVVSMTFGCFDPSKDGNGLKATNISGLILSTASFRAIEADGAALLGKEFEGVKRREGKDKVSYTIKFDEVKGIKLTLDGTVNLVKYTGEEKGFKVVAPALAVEYSGEDGWKGLVRYEASSKSNLTSGINTASEVKINFKTW